MSGKPKMNKYTLVEKTLIFSLAPLSHREMSHWLQETLKAA